MMEFEGIVSNIDMSGESFKTQVDILRLHLDQFIDWSLSDNRYDAMALIKALSDTANDLEDAWGDDDDS